MKTAEELKTEIVELYLDFAHGKITAVEYYNKTIGLIESDRKQRALRFTEYWTGLPVEYVANKEIAELYNEFITPKKGDIVTPKGSPKLAGKIVKITKDYSGEPLYHLENGTKWIKSDLR